MKPRTQNGDQSSKGLGTIGRRSKFRSLVLQKTIIPDKMVVGTRLVIGVTRDIEGTTQGIDQVEAE